MSADTTPRLAVEIQHPDSKRIRLIVKSNDFMQVESRAELTLEPGYACHIRVINGTSSYVGYAPTARHAWRLTSHSVRWHAWLSSNEGKAYMLAKRGLLNLPRFADPTNEDELPF